MANFRLPCEQGQSFAPPYKPNRCGSPSNRSAIDAFGREFMRQFAPVLASPSTGCFVTSCIQHSVSALLRNVTTATAFDNWLNAGEVGSDFATKFVDRCGSAGDGSTPCNPGPRCALLKCDSWFFARWAGLANNLSAPPARCYASDPATGRRAVTQPPRRAPRHPPTQLRPLRVVNLQLSSCNTAQYTCT